jgi:hypothetical protein
MFKSLLNSLWAVFSALASRTVVAATPSYDALYVFAP